MPDYCACGLPEEVCKEYCSEGCDCKKKKCTYCGKEIIEHEGRYHWQCMIDDAIKSGAKVICPNGLPIVCAKADGTLLEHEHADHPDYIMPVDVDIKTSIKETLSEEEFRNHYGEFFPEHHALIYTDGTIAITLHECCYMMWYLNGRGRLSHPGQFAGGSICDEDYILTQDAIVKIKEYAENKKKI